MQHLKAKADMNMTRAFTEQKNQVGSGQPAPPECTTLGLRGCCILTATAWLAAQGNARAMDTRLQARQEACKEAPRPHPAAQVWRHISAQVD
jgi:uncharacterized OsmC-like protein